MKAEKFRLFEATLSDGTKKEVKFPRAKITEKYAILNAWHYAKVGSDEVISIKGIR